MKALVVDDSRVMRTMVMESLRRSGLGEWDFVEAGDGPEALAAFDGDGFDVVLVDWNMPQMPGIDVLRQIRKMPRGKDTPIVMVTSDKTPQAVRDAMRRDGVDGFVLKPFTIDALRTVVARLVEDCARPRRHRGALASLVGN